MVAAAKESVAISPVVLFSGSNQVCKEPEAKAKFTPPCHQAANRTLRRSNQHIHVVNYAVAMLYTWIWTLCGSCVVVRVLDSYLLSSYRSLVPSSPHTPSTLTQTRTTAATATWEVNFSAAKHARKRSISSVQNLRWTRRTSRTRRGTARDAGPERCVKTERIANGEKGVTMEGEGEGEGRERYGIGSGLCVPLLLSFLFRGEDGEK